MNLALDTYKINDDIATVSFITVSFDVSIVHSGLLIVFCVV